MSKYPPILQKCRLFEGISGPDLETLLNCLPSRQRHYNKNKLILIAGEKVDSVGIVLSGAVHIVREDFWGKQKLLERTGSGDLFVAAFAYANVEKLPVSVVAAEETEILFVDCKRIVNSCSSACAFHTRLIKNLIRLLAEKNITLVQKLEHITQPTTREKLLSYLSEQARLAGSNTFSIPFNREELANYLSVERSAMSAELSRMQEDGLIHYQKSQFALPGDFKLID